MINVAILDPIIFLWIYASSAAAVSNLNGINVLSTNVTITFFING